MRKEIYLVRHGETDFNKKKIIQGSGVDSSLNETGTKQSQALFQHYKHLDFEVVITSALVRTHQTVAPFIDLGIPWERHASINEMNWGTHEGKPGTPEMIQKYQEMVKEWAKQNYHARLEEGESAFELNERISGFIEHLKSRNERRLLVCSHGRSMRCMVCLFKEIPLTEMEQIQNANTGLYKIIFDNSTFHFELENDTSHLINVL